MARLGSAGGGMLYGVYNGRIRLLPESQKSVTEMTEWFKGPDVVFIGNADREKVIKMYTELFERVGAFEAVKRSSLESSADDFIADRLAWRRRRATFYGVHIAFILLFIFLGRGSYDPESASESLYVVMVWLTVALAFLCSMVIFPLKSPILRAHIIDVSSACRGRGQSSAYQFSFARGICCRPDLQLQQQRARNSESAAITSATATTPLPRQLSD